MLLLATLANAPDLDFLPGLFVGAPSAFHRLLGTHSLAAALLCGFVGGYLFQKRCQPFVTYALLTAGAYASHLLLDLFAADVSGASGLLLFWPFSDQSVLLPWSAFMSIEKSGTGAHFVASLLSSHNAHAVLREILVMLPALLMAEAWQRWRQRRPQ